MKRILVSDLDQKNSLFKNLFNSYIKESLKFNLGSIDSSSWDGSNSVLFFDSFVKDNKCLPESLIFYFSPYYVESCESFPDDTWESFNSLYGSIPYTMIKAFIRIVSDSTEFPINTDYKKPNEARITIFYGLNDTIINRYFEKSLSGLLNFFYLDIDKRVSNIKINMALIEEDNKIIKHLLEDDLLFNGLVYGERN